MHSAIIRPCVQAKRTAGSFCARNTLYLKKKTLLWKHYDRQGSQSDLRPCYPGVMDGLGCDDHETASTRPCCSGNGPNRRGAKVV